MYLSVGEGYIDGRRIFLGIVHDVSDIHQRERRIRELQRELLHVTRATSMGQMSSALAHELNQPLTAILSYVKAATRIVESPQLQADMLKEVLAKTADQTVRAGDIIKRLRTFVEKREHASTPESINKLITEAIALGLAGVKDSGVQLHLQLSENLPPVNVDKVEIQQVLINLMRNAVEAMQISPSRHLSISTSLDGPGYIDVTIADTGPGMSPGVAQRLFHPFVTTKSDGMGMGLNICRTIIEAHGGRIWLDISTEAGTVFRFRLPVYKGDQ
jgi:two-component system sensor kinase FixL